MRPPCIAERPAGASRPSRSRRPSAVGLVALLALGALGAGCAGAPASSAEEAAAQTLAALSRGDLAALAALVHPEHGVRFTPYAYVRPGEDVVLSASEIRSRAGGRELEWGEYDGTGEPIRLTLAEYLERFVYGVEFATLGRESWEERLGYGNSIDNSRAVYGALHPGARVVEYHVPGLAPELDGLDWQSLRLVFVEDGGGWYLVGVIHDQWTT